MRFSRRAMTRQCLVDPDRNNPVLAAGPRTPNDGGQQAPVHSRRAIIVLALILILLLILTALAGLRWVQRQRSASESPQGEPVLMQEHGQTKAMTTGDWSHLYQQALAAVKTHPHDPQPHIDLSVLLALVKRYDEAASHLEQAVKLAPANAENQSLAGQFYMRFGDMAEAIPHLRRACELASSNLDWKITLAQAYSARGEVIEANKLLDQCSKAAGNSAEMHIKVADAYIAQPNRTEAVQELQRVLSLQPSNALVLQQLAFYELDGGDPAAAIRMLKTAIAAAPDHSSLYSLLGTAYVMSDPSPSNLEQAETNLQRALREGEQDDSTTHYYLGKVYQRRGNLADAAKEMEQAVVLNPGDRQSHYDLAQIYTQLNRPDDAARHRAAFKKIYQEEDRRHLLAQKSHASPGDPDLHYQLGMQFLEENDRVHALAQVQKALELRPHWPQARQKLIELYRQVGLPGKARLASTP